MINQIIEKFISQILENNNRFVRLYQRKYLSNFLL